MNWRLSQKISTTVLTTKYDSISLQPTKSSATTKWHLECNPIRLIASYPERFLSKFCDAWIEIGKLGRKRQKLINKIRQSFSDDQNYPNTKTKRMVVTWWFTPFRQLVQKRWKKAG